MFGKLSLSAIIFYSGLLFSADTQLNLYRPFAVSSKHVAPYITSTISGHCSQQSERIKREDAWHCISNEDVTYDPCFTKRFGVMTTLICPESPWSSRSVQLTVPNRLDERDHRLLDMSRTLPWGIELTSGEHCISIKSEQYFDGLQVHYQCSNAVFLLGAPQRCATKWTILRHDDSGMAMVNVYRAWF